jgi:tetratricopeptide (TPR) repeat protein
MSKLPRRRIAASLALSLSVLAATSLGGGVAHADGPSAEVTEQAKSHFKQGRAYQEAGAFDRAIAEYEEANRLAPRSEMLFNIAQCYRLAGNADKAVEYYSRFVELAPQSPVADEARSYIASLRKQIDADKAAASKQADGPVEPDLSAPASHGGTQAEEAGVPGAETRPRSPALRWVGIGGVAAGAVLVGVGAYFGAQAADESSTLGDETGTWTPELAAKEDAAKSDETKMIVMVSVGGALLVGGAVLWWYGGSQQAVVPEVTGESASLVWTGRF